ncbi:MAG: WecB/TagA/CpsF family glycosyltransferase [Deltaproteobacteria bacterium]|nr:WecB/TagA/CpsF family glycosyltransferase [Deltaproteobacteria bacterium]
MVNPSAQLLHEELPQARAWGAPVRLAPVSAEPRTTLLPRARLWDVLRGKSPFVGSRLEESLPRGFLSPVEARVQLGIEYMDAVKAEREWLAKPGGKAGVALRALIASVLSSGKPARVERRPFIVSSRVDAITIAEATEAILTPGRNRAKLVLFAHPHALNLAYFDPALAKQLERADLVLPDGVGLRIAAQLLGLSLPHNVNGTDMLPLLCAGAADRKLPVVLIGGKPGVAEACAERLRANFPGLEIPIVSDGYLGHRESELLSARVRRLRGALVLVGMGTPIQEAWVWNHLADLPNTTAVTVGGLFDFFAGRVERAPLAWREMGLEWLFRLLKEPRRMARRYLIGNPLFLALAMMQRMRTRSGASEQTPTVSERA